MSPPNQPLRLAIIGLSSSATTSWASSAHLPALLSPPGRQNYTITALLNSSVSAAEAAIKHYDLPSNTKTYGDPQSLADDPDIDAVICSTRVDTHYATILPSVKAGKHVVVEWPIAANLSDARALVAEAIKSGSRVAIMLQGRWAPPVLKISEVLEKGELGKLLSSEVVARGGVIDRASLPVGLRYFTERKVGGNPVVIGFGHMVDFVQAVVGNLDPATTHARMQIQRPRVRIRYSDKDSSAKDEHVQSDVPDLISLHGSLPETPHVAKNATLAVNFRKGQPFKGDAAFVWSLNFEKGELRLSSPEGPSLQANSYENPPTIILHDHATDEVREIAWDFSEEQKAIPARARSILTCLVAFAKGDEQYVGLEDALGRAEQIEGWWESGLVQ